MTAATILHSVEDDVREAVEALGVDGELTSDESGVTFNSKNLTIFARHYGSTVVTVRLSVGNSSTVEVEDTMTIETTNPRSICFAVADTTDRLEALSECVGLLEDDGWSITRAVSLGGIVGVLPTSSIRRELLRVRSARAGSRVSTVFPNKERLSSPS